MNCFSVRRKAVYPRVCGGTAGKCRPDQGHRGLSPRVRGNLRIGGWLAAAGRSIPACAGEPSGTAFCRCPARVYPRVCGGTLDGGTTRRTETGLSPRVRGNLTESAIESAIERSIPACAGEPGAARLARAAFTVYPRVCGGTQSRASRSSVRAGLSPRVRGNPTPAGRGITLSRSIPACAGEPLTW